jgi:hypothetical protein
MLTINQIEVGQQTRILALAISQADEVGRVA